MRGPVQAAGRPARPPLRPREGGPTRRPSHALSGGRLAALGAPRGSTTGCVASAFVVQPLRVETGKVVFRRQILGYRHVVRVTK